METYLPESRGLYEMMPILGDQSQLWLGEWDFTVNQILLFLNMPSCSTFYSQLGYLFSFSNKWHYKLTQKQKKKLQKNIVVVPNFLSQNSSVIYKINLLIRIIWSAALPADTGLSEAPCCYFTCVVKIINGPSPVIIHLCWKLSV